MYNSIRLWDFGAYGPLLRGGVTLKNRENLGQSPKRGGRGLTQTQFFFRISFFLETTNLVSPYLKTCVTVKIWLNLIGWEKFFFSKNVQIVILGWLGDQKKFCFGQSQSRGGGAGGPQIGTQSKIFLFFLVTPPLTPAEGLGRSHN